jgi:hypothetical protein
MTRLPKTPVKKSSPREPLANIVRFSFKYTQKDHSKFCYNTQPSSYFCRLLEKLVSYSTMTPDELRRNGLRSHKIDWEDVTEKRFGIPQEDEIVDMPWQFALEQNSYGRIHGFFISSTFYVVWLDPTHALYASAR